MKIDLHIHSCFSNDGTVDPETILCGAIEKNIKVISITDHACIDAIPIISNLAREKQINVVSGIEFSAVEFVEQHILGYGFYTEHPSLQKLIHKVSNYKKYNLNLITDMLADIGIIISSEYVINGRKDIANVLLKEGVVTSISEAFDKYLDGERYKSLPIKYITPEEAITTINEAGGKAVLAHPLSVSKNRNELMETIKKLIRYGLCGIEAYYSQYSLNIQKELVEIANDLRLFKTSGSDFHGNGVGCRKNFGDYYQSKDAIAASLEFISVLGIN